MLLWLGSNVTIYLCLVFRRTQRRILGLRARNATLTSASTTGTWEYHLFNTTVSVRVYFGVMPSIVQRPELCANKKELSPWPFSRRYFKLRTKQFNTIKHLVNNMRRSDLLAGIGALVCVLGVLGLALAVVLVVIQPTASALSHIGVPSWCVITIGQAFGVASSLSGQEHRESLTWRLLNFAICLFVTAVLTLWAMLG